MKLAAIAKLIKADGYCKLYKEWIWTTRQTEKWTA